MSFADRFKKNATTAPQSFVNGSPVQRFKKAVTQQIAYAKTVKGDPSKMADLAKQLWFKYDGDQLKTKIGRTPLTIEGQQWAKAKDFDELISLYEDLIKEAEGMPALVKQLNDRSAEVSSRLKGTRKKK